MNMTPVRVLRDVRVAHPGTIYGREIVASTDDEIPAGLFDDLAAAGYVAAPENKAMPGAPDADEVEPVKLPADWRDFHHMKLIALAKLFEPAVASKAEATNVLELQEKALAAPENKAIGPASENKAQG